MKCGLSFSASTGMHVLHGILVQSPLSLLTWTKRLSPTSSTHRKDVDGFHPQKTLAGLVQGRLDGMLPCTPSGVMRMLQWARHRFDWDLRAVVLGRSRIVGYATSPCCSVRKGADATVTVVHSRTQRRTRHVCAQADVVVVAAIGRPEMVSKSIGSNRWCRRG